MQSCFKTTTGGANKFVLVFHNKISVGGGVMRVRNFLPIHIDDDTAASFVFWNTVPGCTKVQYLNGILSS